MHVQHAETPRRQHEQPGAGKQNPHEPVVSSRFAPSNPGASTSITHGAASDAGERQHRDGQREQREDRPRDLRGFLGAAARAQARIDGNERSRERALSEEVLQQVGNAERRVERVGGVGLQAEEVRERADAQQPDDPAAENSRGHRGGGTAHQAESPARDRGDPAFRRLAHDPVTVTVSVSVVTPPLPSSAVKVSVTGPGVAGAVQ